MRPRHLPWQQGTRFRFDCAVYLYHTQECGPLGNEERQDRDSLGMHTVLHRRQESFETPENNAGWRLLGAKRRRAVRRQHSALRTSTGLVSACNDRPLYTGGARTKIAESYQAALTRPADGHFLSCRNHGSESSVMHTQARAVAKTTVLFSNSYEHIPRCS